MKRIISLYFVFMLVARPALPLIDYAVNYQYIITKLCENRDRPQLLCNGKCYLSNELKKVNELSQNPANHLVLLHLYEVFLLNDWLMTDRATELSLRSTGISPWIDCFFCSSFFGEIFHPPLYSFAFL